MENKVFMDDIEAFLLDFLAYRRELRERRMTTTFLPSAPNHLNYHEVHEVEQIPPMPPTNNIPHSIGKGWPHNKNFAKGYRSYPEPEIPQNEIIATLTPIVMQALTHFGSPSCPKTLNHLVCQIIANAMTIPQISESIHTAEIAPWGRVSLLQAVIELLVISHQ